MPTDYRGGYHDGEDNCAYQRPAVLSDMQQTACTRMLGCHLIDGAGHWVQQEQPQRVTDCCSTYCGAETAA